MRIINQLLLASIAISCSNTPGSEAIQSRKSNIIDVSENIIDVKLDSSFLIGRKTWLFTIQDYLIACDHQNPEKGIHIYDKNTFEYVTSTGLKGQGPREIVRYAHMGIDNENGIFYMSDYGKRVAFKFVLDSVLMDNEYMPTKSFSLLEELFPTFYDFLNDSIIIGAGLDVIDRQNFNSTIVKCNILNGNIEKIGEPNPKANVYNASAYFSLSKKHEISVETFANADLMIIRDLEGKTLNNVYGPQWGEKNRENDYYYITNMLDDQIIASFIGTKSYYYDENKRPRSVFPTKLLLFDTKGNYNKTLKLDDDDGIFHFCVDEDNNRIIFSFNDRKDQFGYLNLDEL